MKNKLQKQLIVTGLLVSAMAVSFPANGITENVCAAESTDSSENKEELQTLFDESVEDAMIIDKDEILPVVSLDKGEPYAVYDENGRILLYTFHKYPDSYPDGADVKLEWGNVWTFTGGELEEKYQENKDSVTDWQTRLKELIGLRPDNGIKLFYSDVGKTGGRFPAGLCFRYWNSRNDRFIFRGRQ